MQAGAYLRILDGEVRSAAKVIGFVDRRTKERGEPWQSTEQMMRDDMMKRLEAVLSREELDALLQEGASIGPFEADYFAGIAV